jgi:hypothetical protein
MDGKVSRVPSVFVRMELVPALLANHKSFKKSNNVKAHPPALKILFVASKLSTLIFHHSP